MREPIPRPYLLLVNTSHTQSKQRELVQVLTSLSQGTVEAAYFDPRAGAFLFLTTLSALEVRAHFEGILDGRDIYLIVELGGDACCGPDGIAEGWFTTHVSDSLKQRRPGDASDGHGHPTQLPVAGGALRDQGN